MRKAAATVALMTLCGCGGGGGSTPAAPTKTPTSVAVGPTTAGLIKVGDDQAYTATVHWSDGTDTVETAAWSSDNSGVATVDGTGKAHGVNSGEATLIAATTGHGTGTLKIRVVPNYQGTWTGDYTIRGCSATGAFDPNDWCGRDGFAVNSIFPIKLAITQNADKISGTVTLGQVVTSLDVSSSLAIDGGANASGQGTFTDSGGTVVTVTINPMSLRASGPSMTGSFTQKWTAAGFGGGATISSELNSVPRTASIMIEEFGAPPRFSSMGDLLRLLRQK